MKSCSQAALIERIIDANMLIPAKGCRAQHAVHGGHYIATFKVHDLSGSLADLAQGLFAKVSNYPAIIRYSNGKETDPTKPDAHGMAMKVFGPAGDRLLTDPGDPRAIDFVLVDVDTFFSDDLDDYTVVNEKLAPLLQRKQSSDNAFSFWEAIRGLAGAAFSIFTFDDVVRLRRFRGKKEPVDGVERWDLEYSSATPYRLGNAGPVKYKVLPAKTSLGAAEIALDFCVEKPLDPTDVDIEKPSKSWAESSDLVTIATVLIDITPINPSEIDVEQLRFNPWHAPPEHEPLGAINAARKKVYETLADRRLQQKNEL